VSASSGKGVGWSGQFGFSVKAMIQRGSKGGKGRKGGKAVGRQGGKEKDLKVLRQAFDFLRIREFGKSGRNCRFGSWSFDV
jgi:hypothetical protein